MNTSEIYLFMMFIMAENIQKDVLVNTSNVEPAPFYENTKLFHIMTNQLFSALKLNDSFVKTTKIKLLLTIHTCLLKIIKTKNYKLREIKAEIDITPLMDNNKSALYEILQDNTIFPENCTIKEIDDEVTEKLIESIKEFLHKIDKLNTVFGKKIAKNFTSNWDLKNFTRLKEWVPNENHTMRRIFNSRPTRIDWYSFMVSVHVSGEFVCAGSIIKKYFVITSASCLYGLLNPKHAEEDVFVRVGSEFTTDGGVVVPVLEVFLHPWFDPNTLQHNLAILKMDNKIRIAKQMKKISKIAFSKNNVTFMSSIFMLGWGAQGQLKEQSQKLIESQYQKLSYAYVDAYDFGKCKEVYSSVYVTNNNFCAGIANRGSGACAKDLGDPAIVDGMLVGVVSYGPPICGTPDAPTVFTKVSHYAGWIESVVRKIKTYKPALRTPILVTPNMYSSKGDSNDLFQNLRDAKIPVDDYPEEIMILREILDDLAKTNGSLIDEVIDESFDKEILSALQLTTKTDLLHHPLINKSIVPVHGVHIPEEEDAGEYQTVKLTTSTLFTFPWDKEKLQIPDRIVDYNEFVNQYDHIFRTTTKTTTIPKNYLTAKRITSSTPDSRFTEIKGFDRKGDHDYENYQSSQSSQSSDYSKEGLSIEMTTAKIFDDEFASASMERSDSVESNKKPSDKDTHLLFYIDSELLDFQTEKSNKKKGTQIPRKKKSRDIKIYTKIMPRDRPKDDDYDYRFDIDIEK